MTAKTDFRQTDCGVQPCAQWPPNPFFIEPQGDREITAAPEAQDQGARHNDHPPRGWLGFSASGRKDKSTSVLATLRLRKQTIPGREAYPPQAESATQSLGFRRSRQR